MTWIARHVFVRVRNLNSDPEAKPVPAIEIGVGGSF